MPRDKGRHGRTGSKRKAAAAKREAAAAAQAAAQPIQPAPQASPRPKRRRTASTEEQPATPSDAAAQASAKVTEQLAKKTKKMVRFADELPTYRDGRKKLPGSAGWTWGRRWQQPYGASFTRCGDRCHCGGPVEVLCEADWRALQQRMTAVRYADYVAAGCIGPEPREWPDSADPCALDRAHAPPGGGARLRKTIRHGGMPMFPRPIRTRGAPGATCVHQRTPTSPPCGTPRVLIDRYNAIVLPHKPNRHCGSPRWPTHE